MSQPPAAPKIFHITHLSNLPSILADGAVLSDAAMIAKRGVDPGIGMAGIKQRRLTLPVSCHPGDFVGDYVPFYFCPRSVMLYVIFRQNHPELTFQGGQDSIIHLEADLQATVAYASGVPLRWAFTLSNAGARYVEFRSDLANLGEIDWVAVEARQWAAPSVKEGKQAEFLLHGGFPWTLVSRIGVRSAAMKASVETALQASTHRPVVEVRTDWYYL